MYTALKKEEKKKDFTWHLFKTGIDLNSATSFVQNYLEASPQL